MLNRQLCFEEAFSNQKKKLDMKKALFERAIEELKIKNPEYKNTDMQISALGSRLAMCAISGDNEGLLKLKSEIERLSAKKAEILKQSGIKPIEYDCEKCRDTGYINGKICSCIKSEAKKIMLRELSSELPVNESGFDNFKLSYYPEEQGGQSPRKRMTNLLELCRNYVQSFDVKTAQNLLFMGDAGLGKTHLSLAIVSELIKKGYDVIYGSAYNLFSAMENDHFSNKSNQSYEAAVSSDLLVIDDLGSEFLSPFILTCIYNVINTRLLAKRPTIISTNLTMKEIETRYTARISSRLIGNYTAKKFIGEDIRQIKKMEE